MKNKTSTSMSDEYQDIYNKYFEMFFNSLEHTYVDLSHAIIFPEFYKENYISDDLEELIESVIFDVYFQHIAQIPFQKTLEIASSLVHESDKHAYSTNIDEDGIVSIPEN